MTRPQQTPDPWARPPRPQDRKRRWPVFAGVGAAGLVGLVVGTGIGADEPSSIAHTTTIRVVETVTATPDPTTTPEDVPVAPVASAETTTEAPPPAPVTTEAPPPPPPTTEAPPPPAPPAPRVAAVPSPEPAPAPAYYKNCAAARAAGAAPLYIGDPGYRPALDRDGDGIACE